MYNPTDIGVRIGSLQEAIEKLNDSVKNHLMFIKPPHDVKKMSWKIW